MSYVKLDEKYQDEADESCQLESNLMKYFDDLYDSFDSDEAKRWLSIGRTDMEKGLMCLRRAIALQMKSE
jgi:hypothetical protein